MRFFKNGTVINGIKRIFGFIRTKFFKSLLHRKKSRLQKKKKVEKRKIPEIFNEGNKKPINNLNLPINKKTTHIPGNEFDKSENKSSADRIFRKSIDTLFLMNLDSDLEQNALDDLEVKYKKIISNSKKK